MLNRLVGIVFVGAAAYKSLYPHELASLLSFVGVEWVVAVAILGLVAFECSVGMNLMLHPTAALRRFAAIALGLFTVVLVVMLVSHDPRSCSCMRFFNSASANQLFGIGRNAALLGLLCAGKPMTSDGPSV